MILLKTILNVHMLFAIFLCVLLSTYYAVFTICQNIAREIKQKKLTLKSFNENEYLYWYFAEKYCI